MNIESTSLNSDASETQILQQVESEMRSQRSSITPLVAVGTLVVASLYIGILAMAQAPRVGIGVARPTPRWVNWTYSFEGALQQARQNHQKIFIDFYTDWCPACKEMDSLVYTRAEVLAQSQNAVMVKINAEGRDDLAKRYNIRVYPSLVWADENGVEIARHDGGAGAPTLAALMAQNQ